MQPGVSFKIYAIIEMTVNTDNNRSQSIIEVQSDGMECLPEEIGEYFPVETSLAIKKARAIIAAFTSAKVE